MAKTTPSAPASLREQLSDAYGGPIPDETWAYLETKQYIAEYDEGLHDVASLVAVVRELNAAAPAAISRSSRRVLERGREGLFDAINHRMATTADVLAKRASRNSAVQAYRARWLADGLIDAVDVSSWIEEMYRLHLPKAWPGDRGPWEATNSTVTFFGWQHAHVSLQWIDEGAATTKVWCVPQRTPLGELAGIGTKLADQWDWNLGYASNFVLTGEAPPRPGVRGLSFTTKRGFDDTYGAYDYMWVGATIDLEVTPEELAGWWRGLRDHLGVCGRRPIAAKGVELAKFALDRDDSTTIREDMEAWNARVVDEWKFDDWRNYRTAAHRAINALNRPAANVRV
jgi:hypothetical protein